MSIIQGSVKKKKTSAPVSILDNYDPFGDSSGLALFQFDGDITEVSGVYSGTSSSGISYTTGEFGQAVTASGTSQNIEIPDISGVKTITFWASFVNVAYDMRLLQIGGSEGITVVKSFGDVLRINDGVNNANSVAAVPFDGTLRHYALVIKADNSIDFMFNNVLDTNEVFGASSVTVERFLNRSDNTKGFSGKLDQVRFFNKTLTTTELTQIYNEVI